MGCDYSLALSRKQYDEELEKWRLAGLPNYRDEHTNLCSVGYDGCDLAIILNAYEKNKMDDEFISKMERILQAVGTCEEVEVDLVLNWMKKNKGETYIMVCE